MDLITVKHIMDILIDPACDRLLLIPSRRPTNPNNSRRTPNQIDDTPSQQSRPSKLELEIRNSKVDTTKYKLTIQRPPAQSGSVRPRLCHEFSVKNGKFAASKQHPNLNLSVKMLKKRCSSGWQDSPVPTKKSGNYLLTISSRRAPRLEASNKYFTPKFKKVNVNPNDELPGTLLERLRSKSRSPENFPGKLCFPQCRQSCFLV